MAKTLMNTKETSRERGVCRDSSLESLRERNKMKSTNTWNMKGIKLLKWMQIISVYIQFTCSKLLILCSYPIRAKIKNNSLFTCVKYHSCIHYYFLVYTGKKSTIPLLSIKLKDDCYCQDNLTSFTNVHVFHLYKIELKTNLTNNIF